MDYRNDAKLFKALSDENRLQILAQLNAEEKCACVLLEKLAISQPTLSHHMRVLVDTAGGVQEGREMDVLFPAPWCQGRTIRDY